MPRPVTLFTGQWADLPFTEVCRLAADWGYDGLEIACWGDHFEVDRALDESDYIDGRKALLAEHGLSVYAISTHLGLNPFTAGVNFGRLELGLEPDPSDPVH